MKKIVFLSVIAAFVLFGGIVNGYAQQSGGSADAQAEALAKAEQERAQKTLELEEKRRQIIDNYNSAREELQTQLSKSTKDLDIAKKDKNRSLEQKREKDIANLKKQLVSLQKNYQQDINSLK
ncbi:MAG: hypothetical protein LBR69_07880 [Endomicrobium sp.]|jgi:uncharacterized protein YPO0396|nr:hypothetical protein [Endomicrobium sp.]